MNQEPISQEDISYLFESLLDTLSEKECEILGLFKESPSVSPYEIQKTLGWSYAKCHRTMKGLEQKHLLSSHLKPSERSGLKRIYSLSNLGSHLLQVTT